MKPLLLGKQRKLRLLCLGAHSDDIEIGCGGTILRLLGEYPDMAVHWVVFGASGKRAEEAMESAKAFLTAARSPRIDVKGLRDGFLPYIGGEVKDHFEELKAGVNPDLILTHYRNDLHQDHRLVCELTWNTYRDHLIWEYEVPKYDGDLGTPNIFVSLTEKLCRQKTDHLMKYFRTQRSKRWFSRDVFMGLLRLRGFEAAGPSPYAEAFYGRKVLI